ncbi:MAG TPA: alkaline phosphatase family protein, partial [Candidatus Bathyarchaeia archaeon]|nr:alkaline phosphatase family protein [Candidatus Bathyarchaeia archaeon]
MGSRKRVHLIALLSLTIALGMAVLPGPTLGTGHSKSPRPVSLADPFVTPTGVYFDHVVIIMMENEGVYDICHGSPPPCNGTPSNATYLAGLANNYTIGSQYTSLVTTSQPNYVAMISGSMQGCTSAGCPSPITAPNLVDRFEAAGLTWKGYFENMTHTTPGPCGDALNDGEPYTPIHNPFIVFQDITNNTSRCNKIVNANPNTCGTAIDCALVNDLNNSTSTAPNFMFLTPNDCNDMRGWTGCGTSQLIGPGNVYLSKLVPLILKSKTFTTTRSALLVTFDEGNGFCPLNGSNEDCVYASWSGPVAKTNFGTSNLYSHYSVTKTIETNWNLTGFTLNDANADSMAEFFKNQPANYNLYATPETLTTPQGVSANSTITVTSYNNFTGTANLSATSSPSGPSLTLNPTSVTLTKQGSATSKLSLQTSTIGNYTITLHATSGSLTHTNTILVQVVPPDFAISANPSTLTIGQ